MSSVSARRAFAKRAIDAAVREALRPRGRTDRRSIADLLGRVQRRSTLLSPACYDGREPPAIAAIVVRGLAALAGQRDGWLRPVETWTTSGRTAVSAFSSLAHHLLARYPVPAVLLPGWFREDEHARRAQGWFRHVGLGGSLRTAGLPLPLTKRAAHLFAHAPSTFDVEFALRWAQVRALGGEDRLARAVAATRLGGDFEAPEFWEPVLRRLVRDRAPCQGEVWSIVEYLHDRRRGEPDFSPHGRSVEALVEDAAAWEAEKRRRESSRLARWPPSGIGEFRRPGTDGRTWTIRELLGSDELGAEGRAMRHCVASYKWHCEHRHASIWSLALEHPGGRRRLATIEVDPQRRLVVQFRAKFNADPDAASRAILEEWARQERLGIEL